MALLKGVLDFDLAPPWVMNPKVWSHRKKVPVVQMQMILKKKSN